MNFNYLLNGTDDTEVYNRLGQEMQLKTLWGMNFDQAAEFEMNYNEMWWQYYNMLVMDYTSSPAEYQNEMGLAYWQWANSTYSEMTHGYTSWYYLNNYMFPGNMEMKFFQSSGLDDSNSANWPIF